MAKFFWSLSRQEHESQGISKALSGHFYAGLWKLRQLAYLSLPKPPNCMFKLLKEAPLS